MPQPDAELAAGPGLAGPSNRGCRPSEAACSRRIRPSRRSPWETVPFILRRHCVVASAERPPLGGASPRLLRGASREGPTSASWFKPSSNRPRPIRQWLATWKALRSGRSERLALQLL